MFKKMKVSIFSIILVLSLNGIYAQDVEQSTSSQMEMLSLFSQIFENQENMLIEGETDTKLLVDFDSFSDWQNNYRLKKYFEPIMNIEDNLDNSIENDFIEKSVLSTVNGIVLFISSIHNESYNLTIEELNEKIAHYYKFKILQGLVTASNYNRTQTPIDAIMSVIILENGLEKTYIVIEYESVAYIAVDSITVYTPKENVFYKYSDIVSHQLVDIFSIDPDAILALKRENEIQKNIDRMISKFSQKVDWYIDNFQNDYLVTREVLEHFSTPEELAILDYYSFDFLLNEWTYSIELLIENDRTKQEEVHNLLKEIMMNKIHETFDVDLSTIEYNNDNLRIKYIALDIMQEFGSDWDFYSRHRNPIIQEEDANIIKEYLVNPTQIDFIDSITGDEINDLSYENKCKLISIFSELDLDVIYSNHQSTYKVVYDTFGPFMEIIKYLKDTNLEVGMSTSYNNRIPPVNNIENYTNILFEFFPDEFTEVVNKLIDFAL